MFVSRPTIWQLVYDGDPPTDPPVESNPDELQGEWPDDVKAKVQETIKERIDRVKKQHEPIIAELEKLKSLNSLTQQERDKLQSQIKELERATMTKQEIAARERKEAEEKYNQELANTKQEVDVWKSRFMNSTIRREITDAAVQSKAYNPTQIVALLEGKTRLVEKTEEGRTTGAFETRVTFEGRDKDGKPMQMDLSVSEAVAEMEKMSEYGNLFESGLKGGLGKNNAPGKNVSLVEALSSQEAYRKQRDEIKKRVK